MLNQWEENILKFQIKIHLFLLSPSFVVWIISVPYYELTGTSDICILYNESWGRKQKSDRISDN